MSRYGQTEDITVGANAKQPHPYFHMSLTGDVRARAGPGTGHRFPPKLMRVSPIPGSNASHAAPACAITVIASRATRVSGVAAVAEDDRAYSHPAFQ